jgi:Tfp pilus assembly protein PilF
MKFPTLLALLSAACLGALNPVWASAAPASASEWIADGTKLLEQGKLAPAQKAFEAATKADPRSVDAYMKLAGTQIAQNNFTAAIGIYQKTIGLDPNNAKAFIGLGIAYLHSGDKALTRAAFEEAMRIEPKRRAQLDPILTQLDENEKTFRK